MRTRKSEKRGCHVPTKLLCCGSSYRGRHHQVPRDASWCSLSSAFRAPYTWRLVPRLIGCAVKRELWLGGARVLWIISFTTCSTSTSRVEPEAEAAGHCGVVSPIRWHWYPWNPLLKVALCQQETAGVARVMLKTAVLGTSPGAPGDPPPCRALSWMFSRSSR